MNTRQWLLGHTDFGDNSELAQFKYAFALSVLWITLPLLGLFIAGDLLGANRVGFHSYTIRAYFLVCLLLIVCLRSHQTRYNWVVGLFAACSWLVHMSGFMFVPEDEARLVWFFSLTIGAYILIGRRMGAFYTVLSIGAVLLANAHAQQPMSSRGMGTFAISLISMSMIFHVFTSRSVSFHQAMVASRAKLQQLSDQDPLTGVLNRRAFVRQCEHLIQLARRQNTRYAALFIDLDHFKRINDQFGHPAGDAVLKAVARCLEARLRSTDVLGRVGGEEFVAFLPTTHDAGALLLAESLRQAISELTIPTESHVTLHITASVGVATSPPEPITLAELQSRADQAMYKAKAAGRNRVSLLDEPLTETT